MSVIPLSDERMRLPALTLLKPATLDRVKLYFASARELAHSIEWTTRQAEEWLEGTPLAATWAEAIESFLELAERLDPLTGAPLESGYWLLHPHYSLRACDCDHSGASPGIRPAHLLRWHDCDEVRAAIVSACADDFADSSRRQRAAIKHQGLSIRRGRLCEGAKPCPPGWQPYFLAEKPERQALV